MAMPVVHGAMLQCSAGAAPSSLVVLPTNRVTMGGKPAANIMDNKPMVNILPFGVCTMLPNPPTAAQTAAALGVLTPGVCTPVFPGPWMPGVPTVMIGNMPAVDNSCKLMCVHGGVVQVLFGGTTTEQIP